MAENSISKINLKLALMSYSKEHELQTALEDFQRFQAVQNFNRGESLELVHFTRSCFLRNFVVGINNSVSGSMRQNKKQQHGRIAINFV